MTAVRFCSVRSGLVVPWLFVGYIEVYIGRLEAPVPVLWPTFTNCSWSQARNGKKLVCVPFQMIPRTARKRLT